MELNPHLWWQYRHHISDPDNFPMFWRTSEVPLAFEEAICVTSCVEIATTKIYVMAK